MKVFTVDENNKSQRLNKYCARILPQAPQSFIYKMLRKKNITLNGGKASGNEIVDVGDEVKFFLSDETFDSFVAISSHLSPEPIEKNRIVFENNDIIVCLKKEGELSQKVNKDDISINERIVEYLKKAMKDSNAVSFTPGVCNRLDRNTEGLIIAGKNPHAQAVISRMLSDHSLGKYYLAVVKGRFDEKNCPSGGLKLKLWFSKDKDNNKVSVSETRKEGFVLTESVVYPVKAGDKFSMVKVKLLTGKSHQIRAHLAHIGFPIAGDYKYGEANTNAYVKKKYGVKSQLLLAHELRFPKGFTELPGLDGRSICCDTPEVFTRIMQEA